MVVAGRECERGLSTRPVAAPHHTMPSSRGCRYRPAWLSRRPCLTLPFFRPSHRPQPSSAGRRGERREGSSGQILWAHGWHATEACRCLGCWRRVVLTGLGRAFQSRPAAARRASGVPEDSSNMYRFPGSSSAGLILRLLSSSSGSRRAGGGAGPASSAAGWAWQKCQVSGTGRKLVRMVSHAPCTCRAGAGHAWRWWGAAGCSRLLPATDRGPCSPCPTHPATSRSPT